MKLGSITFTTFELSNFLYGNNSGQVRFLCDFPMNHRASISMNTFPLEISSPPKIHFRHLMKGEELMCHIKEFIEEQIMQILLTFHLLKIRICKLIMYYSISNLTF